MRRSIQLSGFCFGLLLTAGVAQACPASYVKDLADQNQGTDLYDKAARVADAYLQKKGINPDSAGGEVIKPYVIGTSLQDHQMTSNVGIGVLSSTQGGTTYNNGLFVPGTSGSWSRHYLNKSVEECVQDCLNCAHHEGHFADGLHYAGQQAPQTPKTNNLGG